MGRSNEAQVKWLKELVSRRGGNSKLVALLAEPPADDAGAGLINGEGVARADTKEPVGTGSPEGASDQDELEPHEDWKVPPKPKTPDDKKGPASKDAPAPPHDPNSEDQNRRADHNDSTGAKTVKVDVNKVKKVVQKIGKGVKKVGKKVVNVFKRDKSKEQTRQPPVAKPRSLRIILDSSGIKAIGPEPAKAVDIQGEIPFESNAKAEVVDAILRAIEKEAFKVSIGGVPAKVELRGAERNDKSEKRLAIKVWVRISIPTIEPPGKDEFGEEPVLVQIGDISSDGKATLKVHYQPPPSKDPKTPTPTGSEVLDLVKPF